MYWHHTHPTASPACWWEHPVSRRPSGDLCGGGGVEQPLPVSPVVVHDLVVQVLLVGQVPVCGQVLLVCLLMKVTYLGFGDTGKAWIRL